MLRNKALGCIVGGAIGDALGYPIEFNTYSHIVESFGENGVTDYVYNKGLISDDTQMVLFTIDGLIKDKDYKGKHRERKVIDIYHSYLDWYVTQTYPYHNRYIYNGYSKTSKLLNIQDLFELRAPGNTCLSALSSGIMGTVKTPINNSKGCGGIMRVAPIGLYFKPELHHTAYVGNVAGDVAAITHGHPLGYIPSAVLACIIHKIVYYNTSLRDAVIESVTGVDKLYGHSNEMRYLRELLNRAFEYINNNKSDFENISKLGCNGSNGWVAEETLAISVYCALKYENDFEKAVIAAVNHDGDSDSTGAVTGNIVGSIVGYNNIPKRYIENLELRNLIEEMALKLI